MLILHLRSPPELEGEMKSRSRLSRFWPFRYSPKGREVIRSGARIPRSSCITYPCASQRRRARFIMSRRDGGKVEIGSRRKINQLPVSRQSPRARAAAKRPAKHAKEKIYQRRTILTMRRSFSRAPRRMSFSGACAKKITHVSSGPGRRFSKTASA